MARFFWTVLILATLVIGGYVYWAVRGLPPVQAIIRDGVSPSKWTQVFGRDNTPILSYGKFVHQEVAIDQVSPHLVDALLATEDRRFYSHFGVDVVSIARAILVDLTRGKFVEGGSTLTQQLARNVFLSNEKSLKRKVREAFLAVKLEQALPKKKILELYLNNIYFGEGAYGIHAASEIYFNKKPSQLSVPEAALLAGLPQAPSRYDPFLNPETAKKRRNEVLANLFETGKIDRDTLTTLQASRLRLNPLGQQISTANRAPFFNQFVMNQVRQLFDLDEQSFWQSGMKVYTTLDPAAQRLAAKAVQSQSRIYGRLRRNEQAALISLNPSSGAILAYVGGTSYGVSQFDRVNSALRSPGSLFKVFTYTTAIEKGYLPSRVYLDEPIRAGDWTPKNFDGGHRGYMTLAQALAHSNNIVAIKVMRELTPRSVIEMAHRMGLNAQLDDDLTLTLGSSGVTLLDMTSAIGVLANKGVMVEPYAIEKIVNRDGMLVYEHYPMSTQVLDRETVDTMVAMMQGVVQLGTARGAAIGRPVAGKTGTSDNHRDGWFVGFTPEAVTGVWVGNDDNAPMAGVTGGSLPTAIWSAFMRPYLANRLIQNFDTQFARHFHAQDFTTYHLENLSEYEANNPLAIGARQLPPPTTVPQLDIDPTVEPLPDTQSDPNAPLSGGSDDSGAPLPPVPAGPPVGAAYVPASPAGPPRARMTGGYPAPSYPVPPTSSPTVLSLPPTVPPRNAYSGGAAR